VPLSPSSIIWYQPMGGDALRLGRQPQVWRHTGHASHTLVVLQLRTQGLWEGDEHPPTLSCGAWLVDFTFRCPLGSYQRSLSISLNLLLAVNVYLYNMYRQLFMCKIKATYLLTYLLTYLQLCSAGFVTEDVHSDDQTCDGQN